MTAVRYAAPELRKDLIAGVTVAAISLPQAMAYALIAGIDPRFGLFSAIVVTAIASALGSSSHLINGPTNAISLVVFSALAFFDPEARVDAYQATFLLALMAGSIQIVIAVLRLGDLTRYISESVVLGFMAGAGLLIALGQVGNVLGIPDRGTGHQSVLHRLWLSLFSGSSINTRALVVGSSTVLLVVVARKLVARYRLPRVDMLVALVVVSGLAFLAGWSSVLSGGKPLVPVVGRVSASLPSFHIPEIKFPWIREMGGSALAVAVLGLLEALAISKSIAAETRQALDYNRQCLAEGLANLGGGFFQCLPGSGSLTRSAINFQSGAVSRVSGLVAAGTVASVVVFLAPLARFIPKAALGGLLLVTAARLVDWKRLGDALRSSSYDAALVLVTAGTAVFASVEYAILVGVALSVALFVPRAARLRSTELVVGVDRVIRRRLPSDPGCSSVVIYDIEGELFFGAAPELDRYLNDLGNAAGSGSKVVVLRVHRARNPDLVCIERLERFLHDMQQGGSPVILSGVRDDLARAMRNMRFERWFPGERLFAADPALPGSSTIKAVRYAFELAAERLHAPCEHCDAIHPAEGDLYYMV
jgi:SulP family sulfate permease